jgi:hypothetical protein
MEHRTRDMPLEARWSVGARIPLWDALWHRILADILPIGRRGSPPELILGGEVDE